MARHPRPQTQESQSPKSLEIQVDANGPTVIANLGTADELKAFIHPNDWNQYNLIIRGNPLVHILNGHVMSEVIDDDTRTENSKDSSASRSTSVHP